MKKAITFTAALAMAVMCSTTTAGTVQAAENIKINVVSKESCQDLKEQMKEWNLFDECFKWGTIIWQGGCQETPEIPSTPDRPEVPEIPSTPETPSTPESPSTPENPSTPETPESPSTPENPSTPETPNVPENTPEQSPSEEEREELTFAEQVVALVNEERAKENLAPLTIDEKITDAAIVRAKEIQTSFSHTRPNGSSFATALKEAGATYRSAGENIAWGQKTPEEVVTAWMNSSGHRANIMNANYSRIGVGHLQNAAGTSYWAQLFAN